MTIWIHSTVNRNCLQDSEPLHLLPNRLFDAIYNVADVIVGYVWAGRETEAYLEDGGFHVICVGCGTCVNRLLVHWFPDRTTDKPPALFYQFFDKFIYVSTQPARYTLAKVTNHPRIFYCNFNPWHKNRCLWSLGVTSSISDTIGKI